MNPVETPPDPTAPRPDVGARRSLRARFAAGPVARAVATGDLRAFRYVRGTLHHVGAARAAAKFSHLGEHAACWLVLGATGWAVDGARRDEWARGLRAVGVTYVINTALKNVLRRHRPALEDLPALIATPTKLSFPSAHASSSFAAARAYAPLVGAAPVYGVAVPMALSRVYLGVHYPSDIAVGAALGTVAASVLR